MPQTILSLTLELQPALADDALDVIARWRNDEEQGGDPYARLRQCVPGLHFMSLTVFSDPHYDPILAFEANTDDTPTLFWQRLAAGYGQVLHSVVRCCKRPAGQGGTLLDAATEPGATAAIAALLQHLSTTPLVAHQGHRGLDRARIEQDASLFLDVQDVLSRNRTGWPRTARELHSELRAALLPGHPWLNQPAPPRISRRERLRDGLVLALWLALQLLVLSSPGLLLSGLNPVVLLAVIVGVGAGATSILWGGVDQGIRDSARQAKAEFAIIMRHGAPLLAAAGPMLAASVLFVAAYLSISALAAALIPTWGFAAMGGKTFATVWVEGLETMTLGLASLGATLPLLLLWLRRLEMNDPAQDEPVLPRAAAANLEGAEDQIAQNHMASIVLVKPGVLRAMLLRTGLRGLGLLLRVVATDGYLGSMRTIHFAHWSLVGNGSRLVFFSNYDGSWESYLDDFIAKAHGGLSLAWGSCVGFPPCRFLVLKGASHGRQFKAWARRSMTPAAFWFSAYPADSVNQIERRTELANGLRRPALTDREAAAWIRTL